VTLLDSWGWEEGRKDVYSDLIFQLMMGGKLGKEFKMSEARDINVNNLFDKTKDKTQPVDLALFLITYNAVDNDSYVSQMSHFIQEARKLKIPFLVLLTQIDKVDPAMKEDPYYTNPTIEDLLSKVCAKIELAESYVIPVVNYTRERERVWSMDRAAFVTLYSAFQMRNTTAT